MGKILNHGHWKKEKGLTLVETVISLAIISIISIAVVSISVYSANAINRNRVKSFFVNESSIIAKYYLSYSESDFYAVVNNLTGLEEDDEYHNFTIYYSSKQEYATSSDYYYHMDAIFSDNNNKLTLMSYNSSNALIYERSVIR